MAFVDAQLLSTDVAVDAVVTELNHLDIDQCSLDELGRAAKIAKRLSARGACLQADIARRRSDLARGIGDRPVENTIDPQHQRSPRDEQTDTDRAGVFDQFPGLEDATRSGELQAGYTDVIAKATKRLDATQQAEFRGRHQDLDETARNMSLHAFGLHVNALVRQLLADCGVDRSEQQHRARRVRMWEDHDTGMGHVHATLEPETYARIKHTIDQHTNRLYHAGRDNPSETRTRDQLTADALTDLILHPPASASGSVGANGSSGTDMIVLIDLQTLIDGLHEHGVSRTGNGIDLPVDTVRRMACQANIIPVVLDGNGQTLDVGRTSRLATPTQRTALRAMYPTCTINGCNVPFDECEIHHLKPWEPPNDGRTDLANLAPLCTSGPNHHAQWHRDGWTGRIDPTDRTLIITYTDGTTEHHPLPRWAA